MLNFEFVGSCDSGKSLVIVINLSSAIFRPLVGSNELLFLTKESSSSYSFS